MFQGVSVVHGQSSTSRKTKKLATTAYHEAGHCVVALAQQLWFDEVTIRREEDSLGHLTHPNVLGYQHNGRRERRAIARACILVCYAGWEAERRFDPDAEEWRSRSDNDGAFDLSREYVVLPRGCRCSGDDAHCAYLDRLRAESRRLVQLHWRAVEAIAQALLERRTLNHDQAEGIGFPERARH